MTRTITRAVVIGAGTMGGGIAAHFANAGIPVYLMDVAAEGVLERLKKHKPPAFFTPETADLVTVGPLETTSWIAEGDWIVEAIFENMDAEARAASRASTACASRAASSPATPPGCRSRRSPPRPPPISRRTSSARTSSIRRAT